MVAPLSLCVTTVRLKQRQWTVSYTRCRAKCRQCSRQNTDNKLQNRLPSLPFHRLKIKFFFLARMATEYTEFFN